HLYQHVEVDIDSLFANVRSIDFFKPMRDEIRRSILEAPWIPSHQKYDGPDESEALRMPEANIKTFCDSCEGTYPFNPHYQPGTTISSSDSVQLFCMKLQCQNCKKGDVKLFIKRDGARMTLVGRDPIEQILTPKYIPKSLASYYSSAVLAFNCNQILPALFM